MADAVQDQLAGGPDVQFMRWLRAGEIRLQVCDDCGRQVFFPRVLCPGCGATTLHWRPIRGMGVVYATTVVRQRPDRGGDYNVAIIELQEGARMMSRVEGISPHEVTIGMPVHAELIEGDDDPLIVFRAQTEGRP